MQDYLLAGSSNHGQTKRPSTSNDNNMVELFRMQHVKYSL
jgi:hypothetical protein